MAGSNYVAYNLAQSRSYSEKAQARSNIGAAALLSLAPAFSTSTNYDERDVVTYGGKLYIFDTAHAAGAWTGADAHETNIMEWERIKSTDYSFKAACTTCVTRGSVTQEDFYTYGIVQGMHVKVSTSGSSWTISTVPSGYAISVVQVFDEIGTLLLDISDNNRPANFDFVVPSGGAYMRVRVRGDADCEVYVVIENAGLSELYLMAGSKQGTDLFEAGNVSMSTSGNGYSDSTTRVRTKNGVNVRVCKGDYIESSDSTLRMFVNFLKDGESTWATKGWYEFKSGRYVFGDNGVAVLLFRLQPESTVSVASILDRMKIVSSCGGFSVGERLMRFINEKPIDFTDDVGKMAIIAATASTKYSAPIPVQGGSFVKVDFPTTDVTGVSTSYLIRGVFLGSSDTTAYRREIKVNGVDTAPALTWILYIPQGVTSIRIGVRAAENVTVTLKRVDVVRIENPLFKSVAHRGSLFLAPPNTIPSFKISAAVGFRYCETDIRETSDGYLVCAHDDDISGVSNGNGNISEMTLAQLQNYNFAKNYCAYFAETLIATYDDFLKCCKNCGMRPYIDIKVNGIESRLVAEAKENGILNESTFVSGDVSVLAAIRALAPNCRLGLLLGDISAQNVTDILTVSAKSDYSDVFFDCNYSSLTSSGIQRAKEAGIALECWTTGTLPDDYVTGLTFNGMTSLEYSVRETEFADVFEVKFG